MNFKNLVSVSRRPLAAIAAGVALICSQAAHATYTVPTYLSTALTDAGEGFAAIIALVAVGVLTVTLGKGGLRMVISWVRAFFSGK